MKIGIIGLGVRSHAYVKNILKKPKYREHSIVALCDSDSARLEAYSHRYFADAEQFPSCYTDWRDFMTNSEMEGVIITTPDYAHMEIALAAMKAKKQIILEKPIEASIERATEIYKAGRDYDQTLMLGFVLRYAPFFEEVKRIVDSGELGEIVSVTASENLDKNHSASYIRRWHRYRKNSGGMMNTKCCHDIDLLNYLLNDRPKWISSFGSNAFYVPRADAADHCCDCEQKDACLYSFPYEKYSSPIRWDCLKDLCVYRAEKEIFDRQMLMMETERGIPVMLELVMFSGEETRKIHINGTKAVLDGVSCNRTIRIIPLDPAKPKREIKLPPPESGHGGGDDGLLTRFFESVQSAAPINDVQAGYLATVTAICSDVSALERKTLLLEDYLLK